MRRPQSHKSCLLECVNPDSSGTSNERERISADDDRRTAQCKADGTICDQPDAVKFVGYGQPNACRVGAIRQQLIIISNSSEHTLTPLAREALRDHLLTSAVQISSFATLYRSAL